MTTVPDAISQPGALHRYNNGAVALHWIGAALILVQIYVGFTFGDLPRGPERADWFLWHKTLGVAILLLSLLRLVWRLMHKPPPFPENLTPFERFAAVWNHRLFYVLLLALPLTGLIAISDGAKGGMTKLALGLSFPTVPGISEAVGEGMGEFHELLVFALIALLALHVAAALKHQFIDKSRVAGRMPPFRSPDHSPDQLVD